MCLSTYEVNQHTVETPRSWHKPATMLSIWDQRLSLEITFVLFSTGLPTLQTCMHLRQDDCQIMKFCHKANILDLYQHPQSTEMNWFERGSTEMTSFERGSTEMTSLHVHCFKHQTKQHKFIPSYKMSKKEQTWGRQVQAVRPCQIPMRTHNYLMSVQGSVEPQRSMQSWLQCDVPGRTATLPPGKVTDHIHHLTVWP